MDKTVLKNFAIYARNKLIQDIKNKASMIGITEKGIQAPLPESTSDMLVFDIKAVETYKIYGREVQQYGKLIAELKKRETNEDYKTAYTTLIEEVAYTWFNRMIAIRFMEVNNYLPDKMRVLSSGREGVNEPEFVTHYEDTSLYFTNKEREQLASWKIDGSATAMDNMFQLLFIKQCNALHENLPELFEETNDYAELLLAISYNDPNGVLYKLVDDIPEEYFDIESEDGNGQVEIIGWMYQYYNTERKDEVFSRPKSAKIQKEDIPAATQLFTPDWIVRYMVENSLGRIWIEKLTASGDIRSEKEIAEEFNWKYYISEAEQSSEVKEKLIEIRKERKNLQLEDIKFIDPAMGSGHILVYAFEVFMQLYESQGYTAREAAISIIENNLYGLDIDKRAYQLSYFACMMKGRQYNRRILNVETKCNLFVIAESNGINKDQLQYFGTNMNDLERNIAIQQMKYLIDVFYDAKEYGSILIIDDLNWDVLYRFVDDIKMTGQLSIDSVGIQETQTLLRDVINSGRVLSQKYHIVVTNPPYMGSRGMNPKLSKYVKDNYPDSKSDLFAVFMERCRDSVKSHGYYAMITQHAWMFLSSYEKLRDKLQSNTICNMVHLGARAFEEIGGEVVQTTSFVYKNALISNYKGSYIRLVDFNNAEEKERKTLEAIQNSSCGYYYKIKQNNFKKIPGMPIAYWVSDNLLRVFNFTKLSELAKASQGMATADNKRFVRKWFEVCFKKISFDSASAKEALFSNKKWFPYINGGGYKKWYGLEEDIVNWEDNGAEIKNHIISRYPYLNGNYSFVVKNESKYFQEGITWGAISSSDLSVRRFRPGRLFSNAGMAVHGESDIIDFLIAFLNSKVSKKILGILSPTLNFNQGNIDSLPIKIMNKDYVIKISKNNVLNLDCDWDSFETSWNFKIHPLLDKEKQRQVPNTLGQAYSNWKYSTNSNFGKLKENEEELNRIFIEIYGLEDELTPEVSDKDITITKVFDTKDEIYDDIKGNQYILTKEDVIKSFISYAVGCMFGRYSLDIEGLAYAGGEWNDSKYSTFIPAKDNIILITDEEYFEDDIVNRFVDFVRAAYGKDTLQENLKFIADVLGGNGTPKEVIRNYFIKDFYNDHLKTYQKRPIYWQYDSGRQNGFKALIYMHRYNKDTTGKLRIDYLHEMQKAYERAIDNLQYDMENNKNPREVAKLEKRLTKLTKQLKECKDYDEKITHLALARIPIDLDDGVKVNYDKIQTDEKGKKLEILTKIR
jgi:type II restriction/modification system DNA methylase subunit YeeA